MIATSDHLCNVVKTALLKFGRTHPEPCGGDLSAWALWYEARRATLLDAARRYDVNSLEYGELFVTAHHSAKQAYELWDSYNRATGGGRLRLVCHNGHVHGPQARKTGHPARGRSLTEKAAQ